MKSNYMPMIYGLFLAMGIQIWSGLEHDNVVQAAIGCTSLVWLGILWMLTRNHLMLNKVKEEYRQQLEKAESSNRMLYTENTYLGDELVLAREQWAVWQGRAKELMMEKGVPMPSEMMLNQYPFDHPIWGNGPEINKSQN